MFFENKNDLNPEGNKKMTLLEKLGYLISVFFCFIDNLGRHPITEEEAERLKKLLDEDTNE